MPVSEHAQVDITKPLLFEIAWEVANKVGGIYTVIKSKAPVTCNEYGDRYCLIGPLSYKTAPMEVEAITQPQSEAMKATLDNLAQRGVKYLYGRWLIEGAPHVLLLDVSSAYHRMNEWKSDLWSIAGIPSPPDDRETNEAIVFGYLVAWFLGEFLHQQQSLRSFPDSEVDDRHPPNTKPAIIAHFHEWLAGVALVLLRKRALNIATIFTTHATLLGRYLCAGDVDFYNNLKFFDVDAEAGKRGFIIGLNARLKHYNSPVTVVAFIIMPASTHSFTVDALKGQAVMKQLKDTVTEIQDSIGSRIFDNAARGKIPDASHLVSDQDFVLLKRRIFALKRDSLPPIVTHNMADDKNDPILNQMRQVKLFNAPEDRVKMIFHPEFLSSNSPLLGLDYEEFVRGCHLGVFPSYYEPWGYTPAECTVMGVPSITTNLSGFGCFMDEMISHPPDYGIYIVDRRLKSVEESCQQLADYMMDFCQKSRRQRINQRNRTERLSDLLDWKRMGLEYVKARWVAIRRKWPDIVAQHETDLDSDEYGAELQYGYESDANPSGLQREDLTNLRYHQKVPRPASAPGSPRIRERIDEDEDVVDGTGGLFEDMDPVGLIEGLKALGVKGTAKGYVPPVTEGRASSTGDLNANDHGSK
ncbi:uncharacterized protein SPPG_08523 [Spizellomyces punctatus DAOM BR117]|uniref:Glycogen [starch] synthase n=1 Tax=Spizellomyces punctatus (strain DAOM BR117) TaxID=645134 RepID=A0A0L0H5G4_SPIPD|nr:uncharacterized protein SPPG_08523 [Spizellomyces punctatus DAOM BR117]KNC96136.1 hypothetical protein SPPG_08523 [Spizellomyces punctatus DAOM BR117]|eukprot:XP_016604176.1 hypothetical protein SPPG_08523 [Spizellomyces punctatus DAOM BR117]